MILRALKQGEEEEMARVAHAAFRVGIAPSTGVSDHEYWLRYYTENPHVTGGETIVAEEKGKIVGGASALRFEMSLGGSDVPMRGFAAVVVPPEARRRKIADAIMRESLGRLRECGEALSMLHPFRMSFYRKFGFGAVEPSDLLRVSPRQLPDSAERARVRPWEDDLDFPSIATLYDEARKQNLRGAGALVREEYWWRNRVLRRKPDIVVYEDESELVAGYAIYEVPPSPEYPRQECHVSELVASTPKAHRGLLAYFRGMEDQYRVIQMALPRGRALELVIDHGLVDAPPIGTRDSRDSVAYAQSANMARLIDVPKALAMHPLPARTNARARVGLDVHDPLENKPISFDVTFEDGAHAESGKKTRERLGLSMDRLAQIYFGAVRATDLLRHGFVEGDERAADGVDAALFGLETFAGTLNHF